MFLRFLFLFSLGHWAVQAQHLPIWTKNKLETTLNSQNDTVYVLNFWATWCKPCIEELPEFKKAQQQWEGRAVRFVFVSLDFLSKREQSLLPFVTKNLSWAEVVQLDAGNPNDWIPIVDENWSGAIPATLFWSAKDRVFREEALNYPQINSIIQTLTH